MRIRPFNEPTSWRQPEDVRQGPIGLSRMNGQGLDLQKARGWCCLGLMPRRDGCKNRESENARPDHEPNDKDGPRCLWDIRKSD